MRPNLSGGHSLTSRSGELRFDDTNIIDISKIIYYTVYSIMYIEEVEMQLISIKDIRNYIGKVRKDLSRKKEMVLTYNGKPIALILPCSQDDDVYTLVKKYKQMLALEAISNLQEESLNKGLSGLSMEEIDKEIATDRKNRK